MPRDALLTRPEGCTAFARRLYVIYTTSMASALPVGLNTTVGATAWLLWLLWMVGMVVSCPAVDEQG